MATQCSLALLDRQMSGVRWSSTLSSAAHVRRQPAAAAGCWLAEQVYHLWYA